MDPLESIGIHCIMHEGIHWIPSASTASRKRDPLDSIGIHCITHQWITAYHQDLHEGIDWIPSGCTATHTKASTGFYQDPLHHAPGDPLDSIGVHCITQLGIHWIPLRSTASRMRIYRITLGTIASGTRASTGFHWGPLHLT